MHEKIEALIKKYSEKYLRLSSILSSAELKINEFKDMDGIMIESEILVIEARRKVTLQVIEDLKSLLKIDSKTIFIENNTDTINI